MTGYPGDKGVRSEYDVAPTGPTYNTADQTRYTPPPPVPAGGVGGAYPPAPHAYDAGTPGMTNPLSTGTPAAQQPGYALDPQYPHHPAVINHNTNVPVPYEMHQEIYVLHSSAGVPLRCSCPSCGAKVITSVKRRPGAISLLTSVLCCFTCCWPCFFLPFCTPACMARVHKCPQCHKIIAVEP